MIDIINVEIESKKAKRRYVLNILLVVLFLLVYISGSIALLISSGLKYKPQMIIDILISMVCIPLLIFYFINLFPIVRHYYKFYRSLTLGTLERRRYVRFEEEVESKTKDGVIYRQLMFSFEEQQKKFYERLYVLDNPSITFERGQLIKVVVFQNVMLKYEAIEDAKN